MNLVYGEVIEISEEDGLRHGTIRVGGALRKVVLDLISEPAQGDRVLLCDGVAISKVHDEPLPKPNYVPRDPR